MYCVDDLHITNDVLPLLDFTLNPYAHSELVRLLNAEGISIETIFYRQAILKGMQANRELLQRYSYNKNDFIEVYFFLEKLLKEPKAKGLNKWLKLWFDKKGYLRLRPRVVQSIQLLHRLYGRYFAELKIGAYPEKFQGRLHRITEFLASLQTAGHNDDIIENRFGKHKLQAFVDTFIHRITKDTLAEFWALFFEFEAYLSLAKAIDNYGFVFPVVNQDGKKELMMRGFYHPKLKTPVKNDVQLKESNVLLLTGPNMSGKSTLLKAIGICVYLAHCGMAVPANEAVLPYFQNMVIAINAKDDLENGYSHFMQEVVTLKQAVLAARQGSTFAVFDELFKGTNVEDALVISARTINGLSRFVSSCFLVSTHLHALKASIEAGISTFSLSCTITANVPVFNYRLVPGWSDLKIGQFIFEHEGLNELLGSKQGSH
ncbi:MAG: hypothetical protein QM642_06550 [Edaphocola sp.]